MDPRREAEDRWRVGVHAADRGDRLATRLARRLVRRPLADLADEQTAFNAAVVKLADALSERIDRADAALAAGERRRTEVEERLLRLERRGRAGASATPAEPQRADKPPPLDYFAFESRMRGSVEEVRTKQLPYADLFADAVPVLDIGCGRGEFLRLLGERGIEARGVDANADMVAFARGEGLDVVQADGIEHLRALADAELGGIFAAQLVEHLNPPRLVELLDLAAARVRPDGLLVLETINPLSPFALRAYFADLTHAQPLVPETLVLLVREAGFRTADVRYANEPTERLEPVELPPDPSFDASRHALAVNLERLNGILYAPLDYAVVARR